jgi:[acyl-carrier-protein] S-malonyltransferase
MQEQTAFIFPGQGAQYPGMGKDLARDFPVAKQTFEEADDLLGQSLSALMFDGAGEELTQTRHCQLALFVHSIAILRVIGELYPELQPTVCGGLSLGEYSALTASGRLPFDQTLQLVRERANAMHEACEATQGTMAVVMGLDAAEVESLVEALQLPNDLWAANFNCPGQVVISGTAKGIEAAKKEAEKRGARRVLPLQVHGAFHSGLMLSAEKKLAPFVAQAPILAESQTALVMNVPGDYVESLDQVRKNLVEQVTHPVRWEACIRAMASKGISRFLEIGAGRTLAGMNKRIGVPATTISIDKAEQLKQLEQAVG